MKHFVFNITSRLFLIIGFCPFIQAQHLQKELKDSLVLSFSFENDSGFYAIDEASGNQTGEVRLGAMFKDKGLYLDGTDDELKYPKSERTRVDGKELSISAWIKMDGTKGVYTILSKFFAYELKVINGHLHFSLVVDGFKYFKAESVDSCIYPNRLHHVSAIRKGEDIFLYVDGVLIPTDYLDPKTDFTLYPANNDIYIGSANGKDWFDGLIYQVEVHKLALNEFDIQTFLERNDIPDLSPLANAGPNIICYPNIEFISLEGSGTDFFDTIITESWSQVYGPSLFTNNDTIWQIVPGEYHFKYTVMDSSGNMDSSLKTVTCYDYSTAILFVGLEGNDETGNGSRQNPFKTVKRALRSFQGGYDLIIHLLPGEHIINERIVIPDRVSLIGSGARQTILIPDETLFGTSKNLDNSLILIENNSRSRTGHFMIDGRNKQLSIGMAARSVKNSVIENVVIIDTYYSGLCLVDISHSDVHSIELINTSWGSSDYSAGAIMIGDADNVNLFDLNISEGLRGRPDLWGYGIKGFQLENSTFLNHLKIYDSKIETRNEGFWNNGEAPNISIEFHSVSFDSCEIFNVEVNSTISLVPKSFNEGAENMRLHHSKIHAPKGVPIESYMINCEIDHNYLLGEYSTIKGFNNNLYSDYLVHHNIFSDQYQKIGASQAMSYGALENVRFFNNTVHFTQFNDLTALELFSGSSTGFEIVNNIFYAEIPGSSSLIGLKNDASVSNVQMQNNVLYNFKIGASVAVEENTYNDDPSLLLINSDAYSIPVPHDTSYVIDAGINVGLPFSGMAPDIGAGDSKVGFGYSPVIDIVSPFLNQSFDLNEESDIIINATDKDGEIDSISLYVDNHFIKSSHSDKLITTYNFSSLKTYLLKVTVRDNDGLMAAKSICVNVNRILDSLYFLQMGPIDLRVGDDTTLQVVFEPEDATNKILTWKSENPEVATVNERGEIYGLSSGESNISVFSKNGIINAEIPVYVTDISNEFHAVVNKGFIIYPNPLVNGRLIIEVDSKIPNDYYQVRLSDIGGKIINTYLCNFMDQKTITINISEYSNGQPFMVTIINSKNEIFIQQKIIN